MFDAKSLLDQFLGTQGGGQPGPRGGGRQGGSGDLLSQGKDFLSSQGGGLALGSLAGLMLGSKSGRKLGKKAVTYGGLALVAGLAYKAYQGHKANQQNAPRPQYPADEPIPLEAPRGTAFDPREQPGGEDHVATALLTAMIAAAKADGRIDAEEKEAIFEKLKTMPLSAEEKAWVFDELSTPLDINAVVARADTPEHAAEIYAASLVAISADTAAEQAYLEALAIKLKLDPALVTEIHRQADEKAPQPAATPPSPWAYTPNTSNV